MSKLKIRPIPDSPSEQTTIIELRIAVPGNHFDSTGALSNLTEIQTTLGEIYNRFTAQIIRTGIIDAPYEKQSHHTLMEAEWSK
tara:strand:+ start:260 stop:511 length:252 start_codon:yes stop_codon:yes gene_type:complete